VIVKSVYILLKSTVGGSRFSFWKSEKQHKFNKPSVLISNYLDFFEQAYQVYQLQNVGLDMVD
jgi:hypothetical protein